LTLGISSIYLTFISFELNVQHEVVLR